MDKTKKAILTLFLLLFISGCNRLSLFKETRILMGTFAEVSCFGLDRGATLDAMKNAFEEMERIEKLFSKFDERSAVSKINALAGTEEVKITPELFKIIERSIYYSRLSGGNFDITVEPLKKGRYKDILLDKNMSSIRFLAEDIKIDLGGVAKGYAVDRVKDILLSQGIENALINIGGNIFALGSPPGRRTWRIGIRDPRNKNDIIYRLNLTDKAISTSGGYERPFHIINPVDGRPAEEVMSVTVVADSAEKADALSTTVFVMGAESGLKFIESLKDIEVFIVDKDGNLVKYP